MPGGVNPNLPDSFQPGDKIPARWMNDVSAGLNRLSQFPRVHDAHVLVNGAGAFIHPEPTEPYFPVLNSTELDIPSYGVALMSGINDQNTGNIYLKQPDTYGSQVNAVLAYVTGIKAGEQGLAQMPGWGPMLAAYDSVDGTPQYGQRWGPRSGTWLLKKDTGGFMAIGVNDTTNHWAWVIPLPMWNVYAKNNSGGTVAKGTVANGFTAYSGASGSESNTGQTINGVLARYGNIAANAFCELTYNFTNGTTGDLWVVIQTDTCPP